MYLVNMDATYSNSFKKYSTTAHLWCSGHSTNINACGVRRVRVRVKVSSMEFHIHIHLD